MGSSGPFCAPPQRRQVPAHINSAQSPALSGMGCLVGELTVTHTAPHVFRGGATGQERVHGPSSQPDGHQQAHHVPSPRNSLEGGLAGARGKLVHLSAKPFSPPFPFMLPDHNHRASASCPVTSTTGVNFEEKWKHSSCPACCLNHSLPPYQELLNKRQAPEHF